MTESARGGHSVELLTNSGKTAYVDHAATHETAHLHVIALFGTARRGLGGAAARPDPSSLYQM